MLALRDWRLICQYALPRFAARPFARLAGVGCHIGSRNASRYAGERSPSSSTAKQTRDPPAAARGRAADALMRRFAHVEGLVGADLFNLQGLGPPREMDHHVDLIAIPQPEVRQRRPGA